MADDAVRIAQLEAEKAALREKEERRDRALAAAAGALSRTPIAIRLLEEVVPPTN